MKNIKILVYALLILVAGACSKDEEPLSQTYQNLIGEWAPSSLSVTAQIDGKSFVQFLIDDLGFTEEEAQAAAQEFVDFIGGSVSGTIEFKNDGTYAAVLGGDSDAGTWSLTNSDQIIMLTENGSTESTELGIKTISQTLLVVEYDETAFVEFDGSEMEVVMEIELTLDKQ